MTEGGAYLPCKNPSCKSHGQSHPNCRCYSGQDIVLAEGGEIPPYCDKDQAHKPDCEYFAEGGEVATPPIPQTLLSNSLKSGLFKGHHEVSDALLGYGDPTPPAAAVMANGGAPSLFKLASSSIFEPRVAQRPKVMADRAAALVSGLNGQEDNHPWNKKGRELKDKIPDMLANPKEADLSSMAEGLAGRDIHSAAKPFISPVSMKLLSQNATPDEMEHGVTFAEHIGKGFNKIDRAIDSIFGDKPSEHHVPDERMRDKLKEFIGKGALHDQISAEGAPLTPGEDEEPPATEGTDPIAKHYPEQNTLLQAARGRVDAYLNSLKPQPNQPGTLLMDPTPVTQAQKRTYDHALDIANEPLSILSHVKTGTVTPEQIKNLTAMYPEVYQELTKKLTTKLVQDKADGKALPYRTRQSLSLFLGQPLDSTMTPQSIQTIQGLYAAKQAAQQQPAPKNSKSQLSKLPQNSQTSDQALAARQLRDK